MNNKKVIRKDKRDKRFRADTCPMQVLRKMKKKVQVYALTNNLFDYDALAELVEAGLEKNK